VNPILPYEQLLADKVQQVPVPDMADAIWAAIEQELDKGTPGDDGSNEPSSPKSGGSPGVFAYIAGGIVIGSILLTYILTDKKKETATNKPSPSVVIPPNNTQQNIPIDSNAASPVNDNPASVFYKDVVKNDSSKSFNSFQQTIPLLDSLLNQQVSRIQQDSVVDKTPSLVSLPVKIDSMSIDKGAPPKKSRGVKGITNDDYYIKTEKKDSTP
jgi:hypothetical protein